jgi:3'-phosphoadenosine 5'-phosphosulfate sulfotransferase (PAPS reductase)/FAD synthetase
VKTISQESIDRIAGRLVIASVSGGKDSTAMCLALQDAGVAYEAVFRTEDDVIAIHQRHGVAPNRSYFRGSSRVGCWPCIRSNKAELRALVESDPERVAIIEELERIVNDLHDGMVAEGKRPGRGTRHSFFKTAPVDGKEGWEWPIRKVEQWARTSHGGRQFELFAARPHELGCVRWGMCEMVGVK